MGQINLYKSEMTNCSYVFEELSRLINDDVREYKCMQQPKVQEIMK